MEDDGGADDGTALETSEDFEEPDAFEEGAGDETALDAGREEGADEGGTILTSEEGAEDTAGLIYSDSILLTGETGFSDTGSPDEVISETLLSI